MNEWDAYQAILDNYGAKLDSQSKLIVILLIFCGVNLVSGIANIIVQFRLQKGETSIHKRNLKEEKSIAILTELYDKLQRMTTILSNTSQLLGKVKEAEKFINANNLFISKEIKSISYEFCDYFKEIMTDWRKKDYSKENKFLEKYKSAFNK